jgi:membrane fusion protein (multidrug efflux system)
MAAAAALVGCGKHDRTADNTAALPPAIVRVETVQSKVRPVTEEVVGTVRARQHATLEAKVSGRIEALPVKLGERVEPGQLIARLEAEEIRARLDQAAAALEQAERDHKRVAALFAQQGATQAELDAADSRLRGARGAVSEAKAMLGYVEVTAPFAGLVTKKWVDVGDLAVPGKPLVDIQDPAVLQLEADVPEAIASSVTIGARMEVRVDSVTNTFSGVVSELAPVADPSSRTFRVKLDLPAGNGLMPGQFARLRVPIGESRSLRVPLTALVRRGQIEIVFVVNGNRAQLHLVKTGEQVGSEIEVLSGLDSGQAVVVDGAAVLSDGQPVSLRN